MTRKHSGGSDVRELRDAVWHDGTERGLRLAAFIDDAVGGLSGKSVLDLGCGAGGITHVLARSSLRAVGLDSQAENLGIANVRTSGAPASRASFVQGNALDLPFRSGTFDVVLMSGLLEWMGFAAPESLPRTAQLETLKEAHRVLALGGSLFVGIENRLFPKFLMRSPHQRLPFALLLPSRVAWALPQWVFGEKVCERLYGPRGLKRLLLEAGFGETDLFIPLYGYQFPRAVVRGGDRAGILTALERISSPPRDAFEKVASGGRRGRQWMKLITMLGLQSWLAPCLIALGRRTS